jgi:universal stress protein family protein
MGVSYEGDTMLTFMVTGEDSVSIQQAHRRMIIVGVDDSAEAEAAAKWAVREAELRKDDLMLLGYSHKDR